jgi:hypothetical protein
MTIRHFPATLTLLALAYTAAGCSGSSTRTVTVGATGAAATSGTSGAPGTAAHPPAPASQGVPLDVFNAEIQHVWDRVRPGLEVQLQAQAQAQLAQTLYANGALQVEIVNVRTVRSQLLVAPGLSLFTHDDLRLRAPLNGGWDLILDGDIRVRVQITGGFAPAVNVPVQIRVEDLVVEAEAEFDHSDPTRPTVTRVGQPKVDFKVVIDSSSSLVQNVTTVLTPVADLLAQLALKLAMGKLTPILSGLQGLPGPVPAAGAPALTDSGVATPFAEIVGNVERKIRRDHLPHGTILHAIMDAPATDSWASAYVNGGTGNPGTATAYMGMGDSAIFTGQYLATQAFRYATTRDPDVLGTIHTVLGGIGKLLDVNGGTGLLARCAAPDGSLVARDMGTPFGSAQIGGQTWVGYQGRNGISRDQYSGVFFGLSIAYDLVDDPGVKAECALRLRMMLDYLIRHDWIVDEDRPPMGLSSGSRGPTFWAGGAYQKLAFLLMGYRVDPAAYGLELAQAGPLSEFQWINSWFGAMGNDHYYKFNLAHLGYYNYFRLETDPQRWQDLLRGYRITRRFVGHHRNPHFDLIHTSVDPSTRAVFFPQVREVMRQFLERSHRQVAPPVVDLSGVTYVPVTSTSYTNGQGGVPTVQTQTVLMPDEPLHVPLRAMTGHFLWQRTPFSAARPGAGNPNKEKHGLDAVGPYWMGAHVGAF